MDDSRERRERARQWEAMKASSKEAANIYLRALLDGKQRITWDKAVLLVDERLAAAEGSSGVGGSAGGSTARGNGSSITASRGSFCQNPLLIAKVKFLVEKAAAAAMEGEDSAACRERVLHLLCAAQSAAAAVAMCHNSITLMRLRAELWQLTAGCSGPAFATYLACARAVLERGQSKAQSLLHPADDMGVVRIPALIWGMDPSREAVDQDRQLAFRNYLEAARAAMESGATTWREAEAKLPDSHLYALEQVHRQAKGEEEAEWWEEEDGSSRAGSRRREGEAWAAQLVADTPFQDNERDRSLLWRFGQQTWLRGAVRERLAARFPPPGGQQQIQAYLLSQLRGAGDPQSDRAQQLQVLLAECCVPVGEVVERVLPHMEPHVREALQALLEAGGELPAVVYLQPGSSCGGTVGDEQAGLPLLLSQADFEAAFERAVLDAGEWETQLANLLGRPQDEGSLAAKAATLHLELRPPGQAFVLGASISGATSGSFAPPSAGAVPAVLLPEELHPLSVLYREAVGRAGADEAPTPETAPALRQAWHGVLAQHSEAMAQLEQAMRANRSHGASKAHEDVWDFVGSMLRGDLLLRAAAAADSEARRAEVVAAHLQMLAAGQHIDKLLDAIDFQHPHGGAVRQNLLVSFMDVRPETTALQLMACAQWGLLLSTLHQSKPGGTGMQRQALQQAKQAMVDGCLRALHLLHQRRASGAWIGALSQYLCHVSGISHQPDSGGGTPWDHLNRLGSLPFTALVPLHAVCCWMVGESFAGVADVSGEAQAALLARAEQAVELSEGCIRLTAASLAAVLPFNQLQKRLPEGHCPVPGVYLPAGGPASAEAIAAALAGVALGGGRVPPGIAPQASNTRHASSASQRQTMLEHCRVLLLEETLAGEVAQKLEARWQHVCAAGDDVRCRAAPLASLSLTTQRQALLPGQVTTIGSTICDCIDVIQHLRSFYHVLNKSSWLVEAVQCAALRRQAVTHRSARLDGWLAEREAALAKESAFIATDHAQQQAVQRTLRGMREKASRGKFAASDLQMLLEALVKEEEQAWQMIPKAIQDLHAARRRCALVRAEEARSMAHAHRVPLHRPLLEGLLKHCLADRWGRAAEEQVSAAEKLELRQRRPMPHPRTPAQQPRRTGGAAMLPPAHAAARGYTRGSQRAAAEEQEEQQREEQARRQRQAAAEEEEQEKRERQAAARERRQEEERQRKQEAAAAAAAAKAAMEALVAEEEEQAAIRQAKALKKVTGRQAKKQRQRRQQQQRAEDQEGEEEEGVAAAASPPSPPGTAQDAAPSRTAPAVSGSAMSCSDTTAGEASDAAAWETKAGRRRTPGKQRHRQAVGAAAGLGPHTPGLQAAAFAKISSPSSPADSVTSAKPQPGTGSTASTSSEAPPVVASGPAAASVSAEAAAPAVLPVPAPGSASTPAAAPMQPRSRVQVGRLPQHAAPAGLPQHAAAAVAAGAEAEPSNPTPFAAQASGGALATGSQAAGVVTTPPPDTQRPVTKYNPFLNTTAGMQKQSPAAGQPTPLAALLSVPASAPGHTNGPLPLTPGTLPPAAGMPRLRGWSALAEEGQPGTAFSQAAALPRQATGQDSSSSSDGWGADTFSYESDLLGLPGVVGGGEGAPPPLVGYSSSEASTGWAQGSWQTALAQRPLSSLQQQPQQQQLQLAGLQNETGEYNCFLNVIIQCLWRCTAFRQQVLLSWAPLFYEAHPVVLALRRLFEQLQQQEAAAEAAGSAAAATASRRVVDPSDLRLALSSAAERKFGIGEMNDAGEVLLTIYESIDSITQAQRLPSCVEPLVGLPLVEGVSCATCRLPSHQQQYTQYFFNTQAAAMRAAYGQAQIERRKGRLGASSMGKRLGAALAQEKTCDTDKGGCGRLLPVQHRLLSAPRVFSLQLTWPSHAETPEDIGAALRTLDDWLSLGEVYRCCEAAAGRTYRLRSLVCYYGQHYSAFVALPELGGEFALFDDTKVVRVGGLAEVVRRCEAGRIQPSLLFYEAEG